MNKNITTLIMSFLSFVMLAGDTNFVIQVNELWKAQNASNLLVFTEINLATNRSPETLLARGVTAAFLQEWGVEATNLFEQAVQMISTNNAYSETGKTKAMAGIQMYCLLFPSIIENFDQYSQPTWNTNMHMSIFMELNDEAPLFDELMEIATIENAEEQ